MSQPAYTRNPEAKRQSLLDAAQDLFAHRGYERTTTAQIAAAAGVSEGILFHHFGSKKGLFIELAQQYARAAAAATMPDQMAHLTEEFVVRTAFDFAEANPALYDMMSKGTGDLSFTEIAEQNEALVSTIEHKLQQAMATGTIRPGNTRIMARLQFAVVDGAFRAWRAHGSERDREDYICEAIACMQAMLHPAEMPHTSPTHVTHHIPTQETSP